MAGVGVLGPAAAGSSSSRRIVTIQGCGQLHKQLQLRATKTKAKGVCVDLEKNL